MAPLVSREIPSIASIKTERPRPCPSSIWPWQATSIVDATILGVPSSTKTADKARDPEMHQTRKGQQCYFGMKLHIGVDSQSGLAPSAVVTAANAHGKHPLPDLLHGAERRRYGDSAYASQKALIESKASNAKHFTNQRTRRGGTVDEAVKIKNRNKSRIRARVGHVFGVAKRLLLGFGKVRCRELQKNATRAFTVLALDKLYLGRATTDGTGAPVSATNGLTNPQEKPGASQERSLGDLLDEIELHQPGERFDGAFSVLL